MAQNTIKVKNEAGEELAMSTVQFELIGSDPKTNGGWTASTPKEAKAAIDKAKEEAK